MSKVISATAPCSWGVWYADGSPSHTPYEVFLDQAAEAGYQSLELGPDGYLPIDVNKLREELEKRNLDICAGTACYKFDEETSFESFRPRVEALCQRLNAFDAKYLVVMDESDVGTYSEKKSGFSGKIWTQFLEKIKLLVSYARESFGIQVVYHPHIRSMIETEAEIIRMMEHTDVELCFDTGHHAYVNGGGIRNEQSAINFIKRFKERVTYLHFKNVDYDIFQKVMKENLDVSKAFELDVMCNLADGIIDYKELKMVLDEINFNGIGVIEQDMPKATTAQAFAAAKENLEYLRSLQIVK